MLPQPTTHTTKSNTPLKKRETTSLLLKNTEDRKLWEGEELTSATNPVRKAAGCLREVRGGRDRGLVGIWDSGR